MVVILRVGEGGVGVLHWGAREYGEMLNTYGDRIISGERRTLCSKRQGRRRIFRILVRRKGTPGWADDPVQVHTGQPEMA